MNKLKFGSYIKESRMKKNYTQQELADLLFVDVTTVSKWERGVSYPDITLVPDICRVLDISEHELISSSHDDEYRKVQKDAKKFNNMKKGTFWTLNICYIVALLTCFIVNVTVNGTLSWFFIVLASILCSYSFCPTFTWLVTKYKKPLFILTTFISMSILFFTCSMYTHNYWFAIATLGVLLGYFIAFYPILFKEQKRHMKEEKYNKFSKSFLLSYVLGMLVIVTLLLIAIYLYFPFNLTIALLIVGVCFVFPILFGVLNLFDASKRLNKPILLSLLGVLAICIIAGLIRSVYLKSTETIKTYSVEETYNSIDVSGSNVDVSIYLSKNNENKVVYSENKKIEIETKVIDGVLTINQNDNRKFYDMLFNFSDFKVDLYLTEEVLNSLNIQNSTGDIEINEGLTFNNVNIENSTGDLEIKSNVINNLNAKNSTGDIEIENITVGGNINLETSTGDIDIKNVHCNKLDIKVKTGDIELEKVIVKEDFNMTSSTGDLEFNEFDAANIYVTVGTGDVEGTIISSKIFMANSETGKVRVPETLEGGVCKIKASTGNIIISLIK